MAADSFPVEHLFTITASTTTPAMIPNAPQGTRVVVGVTGGTFEGPKMKGKVADSPGGDWLTSRADGSLKLDVRITLITDDGATILMSYQGIGIQGEGGLDIRTAPLFETGDERYAWLNRVQGIARGKPGDGNVTYEVFALK